MEALRCTGLTREFRGRRVVDDVSLALEPGQVLGLVGRNGAGKSTLLKMMAGFLAPTAGTVAVRGRQLAPCQTSDRLGFLIEHPTVNTALSGFQNVMMRAIAQGLADPKAAAAEALAAVGLEDAASERAKGYSVGMRQRLGLALALVGKPDVLLLDEPFNGLDPEGVRRLRRIVAFLAETRGVATIVSSHVLDQLDRMVTDYGVLHDGRLVRRASAEEVAVECMDCLLLRTPDAPRALAVLQRALPKASFAVMADDSIRIGRGPAPEEVGRILLAEGVPVSGLSVHARDIEDYFVGLMEGKASAAPGSARQVAGCKEVG